ncbi:MAG: ribosomal subunit interface protein [Cellvibrionaceae bacterium]|jgi:ribosomal subunit interface protein
MTILNQITYRDMDPSEALSAAVEKRLNKLERFCSDIKSIRVVLESPHNHKNKGKEFRITLEIDLKGDSVAVSQDHLSMYAAIRDAFNVAERKLKSHTEKQRDHRSQRPPLDELVDTLVG